MKRLMFAVGVLALGLAATAPAHADYAIVKFNSGYCRIYDNTAWPPPDGTFVWFCGATIAITACRPCRSPSTSSDSSSLGTCAGTTDHLVATSNVTKRFLHGIASQMRAMTLFEFLEAAS